MCSLFKKAKSKVKDIVNPAPKLTSNFLIDMRGVIVQQNMTPEKYCNYLYFRPDKREENAVITGDDGHRVTDVAFKVSTKEITALLHHETVSTAAGIKHFYSATLVDLSEAQVLHFGSEKNAPESQPEVKELDVAMILKANRMLHGLTPQ